MLASSICRDATTLLSAGSSTCVHHHTRAPSYARPNAPATQIGGYRERFLKGGERRQVDAADVENQVVHKSVLSPIFNPAIIDHGDAQL